MYKLFVFLLFVSFDINATSKMTIRGGNYEVINIEFKDFTADNNQNLNLAYEVKHKITTYINQSKLLKFTPSSSFSNKNFLSRIFANSARKKKRRR